MACRLGPDNTVTAPDAGPVAVGVMRQLSQSTVRLITSSQVITSVVSAVKELIENSLDAKATSIEIKLENYGFDKIEVCDNGTGIKVSDAPYMAQAHYTSKLSTTDDLTRLHTYGFRGEALGSLCSMANVFMTTKTADDDISVTYILSPKGEIMSTKPSHLGQGTTVIASNLFKNLPVRKQFYNTSKKRKEEMKRVEDLVIAYGIVCHDVRFILRHNKDVIWQKNPMADVRGVLITVFGTSIVSNMEHVKRKCLDFDVEVELFVPKPSADGQLLSRSTNDRCFVFVNKRHVMMKEVEKILRQLCNRALCIDSSRYPLAYMHITVAACDVDVNLEPNKTQVMLQNKENVLGFLSLVLGEVYEINEIAGSEVPLTAPCNSEKNSSSSIDPELYLDIPQVNNITHHNDEYKLEKTEIFDNVPSEIDSRTNEELINNLNIINTPERIHVSAEAHHEDQVKVNSLVCTNRDKSEPHINFDLLDDFEDDSFFDIPTPKMERAAGKFRPICSSTQVMDGGSEVKDMSDPLTSGRVILEPSEKSDTVISNVATESDISPMKKNNQNDTSLREICNNTGNLPHSLAADLTEKWAHGTALVTEENKVVQPVQLLMPGANFTVDSPPAARQCKTQDSKSDHMNQSSLYDVVPSGEKLTSAYIYFSKDIRRKVIAENPNASFQQVARMIGDKWKDLTNEEKQKYEDLVIRESSWKQFQDSNKLSVKKQSSASKLQHASKKRIIAEDDQSFSIKKLFSSKTDAAQKSATVTPVRYQQDIKFSLQGIQAKLKKGHSNSQRPSNPKGGLMLIGQVRSQCAWVCCYDNQLALFQPIRAQEQVIYERLMANHKFVPSTLDTPIELTHRALESDSLWQTLLSLRLSAPEPPDPYRYFTDPRLTSNGFTITHRLDSNTGDLSIRLVAMTTAMNDVDIRVLCHILRAIHSDPEVTLGRSRPNKVKHYLQGEAVRMSRQLPTRLSEEEVTDLMRALQQNIAHGKTSCFHGQPFFLSLYDLDASRSSQDSCDAT